MYIDPLDPPIPDDLPPRAPERRGEGLRPIGDVLAALFAKLGYDPALLLEPSDGDQ